MLWACFKFGLWTFKMALYGDVARRWAGLLTEDSHFFFCIERSRSMRFFIFIFFNFVFYKNIFLFLKFTGI